jgi:hypothetical protein
LTASVFPRRSGWIASARGMDMRYAMAWLLGVPGILILLWMLASAR